MNHLSEERLLEIADLGLEDEHVRACAECAAAVDDQRRARAAVQAVPLLELPAERVREIVAALPEQQKVRRLRGWPRLVAVAAPVAAAAVAIAVVSLDGGGERPVAAEAESSADQATALTGPAQDSAESSRSSEAQTEEDADAATQSSPGAGGGAAPKTANEPSLLGWSLVFPGRAEAEEAAAQLRDLGFEAAAERRGADWTVDAVRLVAPDETESVGVEVAEVATRHDGRVDGMFSPGSAGTAP